MTRIWNCTDTFPDKVNFIDINNVILGYDLRQSCCEHAFWTVSKSKDGADPIHEGDNDKPGEIQIEGYAFDPDFHEMADNDDREHYVAIFKLVDCEWDGKPDLYVRIENHHNGYYSHGFTFRGNVVINDDL